jgi:hypothetical protein
MAPDLTVHLQPVGRTIYAAGLVNARRIELQPAAKAAYKMPSSSAADRSGRIAQRVRWNVSPNSITFDPHQCPPPDWLVSPDSDRYWMFSLGISFHTPSISKDLAPGDLANWRLTAEDATGAVLFTLNLEQ